MLSVVTISLPVFSIILLGYIFGRKGLLGENASKVLSMYVFHVAMPPFLFLMMSRIPVHHVFRADFIAAYIGSTLALSTLLLPIVWLLFSKKISEIVLHLIGGTHPNSGYLGIPITVLAFGDPSPAILVTMIQLVLMTTIFLLLLEIDQQNGKISLRTLRQILVGILLNPLIVPTLAGMGFALAGITMPKTIASFCEVLGNAAIPTALFALGLSLARKWSELPRTDWDQILTISVFKVLLHPFIAMVIGVYVFHLPEEWLAPLVILSAMPSSTNQFVFSQRYGILIPQSAATVMLTTTLSVLTITGLLIFFGISDRMVF